MKRWIGCWLVLCALLAAGCQARTPSSPAVIVIRVGHEHTATHSYQLGLLEAQTILDQQTHGRIRLEIHHSGELGNERQMQEMVAAGTLDMTITGLASSIEPAYALFDLPYLYQDLAHVQRVIASGMIEDLQSAVNQKGLRIIGVMGVGYRNITSNRPIRSLQDLQGFRIRVPESPAQIETFKALGAIPTPMSFNLTYNALRDAVVEGQENPLENIYNARMYEVQHYVTLSRHIFNLAYVFVSEKFWQRLTAEDQAVLSAAIQQGCRYQLEYVIGSDQLFRQKLEDLGMVFIEPDLSSFQQATLAVYQSDFVSDFGPRADQILAAVQSLRKGENP